jgi:catalase
VQTVAVRERVVSMLANVAEDLARAVADGLGLELPAPMPKALEAPVVPEVESSPALSLFARPGDGSIRTRQVAILVADGVDGEGASALHDELSETGAVPRFVGARLGAVRTAEGDGLDVEVTLETTPSVLYDADAITGGEDTAESHAALANADEYVKDQYRHCKPILVLGAGAGVLKAATIPGELPSGEADPGILSFPDDRIQDALDAFMKAIARHRHFERALDPPLV